MTSSEIRTIIKLQSSEIKTELSFNSFVNVSGKYIVSDFRTKINRNVRKGGNMYEKYRKLRDERNLTDSEVARGTGITKSTFSDWKAGRSNPGLKKIQKISKFLGVAMEDLLEEI